MKVKDIYDFLDKFCPFNTALDFDNAGLLIGDENSEVRAAVIALDCTEHAVNTALSRGANLIITHHPVIFDGLKSIPARSIPARLIKNNINVISAHTNLDIAESGVNDCLCEALGLKNIKTFEAADGFLLRSGELEYPLSSEEFALYIKEKLNFAPRYVAAANKIKKIGVCSGGGGEYLTDAVKEHCDAFLTGEIKHHTLLSAYTFGIGAFDCGHFATEDVVIEPLAEALRGAFPDTEFFTDRFSAIRSL